MWLTQEAESAQLVQGADLGFGIAHSGADWRKQVAAVTAGSRLGAVLVLAGGTSSKNCVCVLNRRALYDHVRR